MAEKSIKGLIEVPNNRVYLTSYFTGSENEVQFEVDPASKLFFLVVNGPPPMKKSKVEMGVKIYRVPDDAEPLSFCKENGGYCCKGKELDYVLARDNK